VNGGSLPIVPVLAVTTATQALTTLAALAMTAVAPKAALDLGISPALVGYQIGVVYFAAMAISPVGVFHNVPACHSGYATKPSQSAL